MMESVAPSDGATWRSSAAVAVKRWAAPHQRRRFQLVLAGIWLLDAALQYQSFIFTKAFAQMLAGTSAGNPAVVADPINWSVRAVPLWPVARDRTSRTIDTARPSWLRPPPGWPSGLGGMITGLWHRPSRNPPRPGRRCLRVIGHAGRAAVSLRTALAQCSQVMPTTFMTIGSHQP